MAGTVFRKQNTFIPQDPRTYELGIHAIVHRGYGRFTDEYDLPIVTGNGPVRNGVPHAPSYIVNATMPLLSDQIDMGDVVEKSITDLAPHVLIETLA